jgi:cephalosporin-C deacetylase-like acetyl esterase
MKTRPPKQFAEFWASRCVELLQTRSNVPQKDIDYLAEAVAFCELMKPLKE